MDRNALIQTNAIIITGLLILLGFQSLSTPMYEGIVSDSLKRMADDGIEYNQINDLFNKYCINLSRDNFTYLNSSDIREYCAKLEIEKIEAGQHGDVLYKYLESWGVLKNNTATVNVMIVVWGPLFVKIAVGIILIPFILSILIELVRKSPDLNASKISVDVFYVGMIFLLLGMVFFIVETYSTGPWNNFHYPANPG